MLTNLPNILTVSRICAVPVLVALFFFDGDVYRWSALGIYVFACLTDFFDGYLARTRQETSAFGRFLDPVADKLLVSAVLLMLAGFEYIGGLTLLPTVVILCREILVSGLREFLAEVNVSVPVTTMAKWKTTIQMFALGFLVVGTASPDWIPSHIIGVIGLWAAAILTLVTGYDYWRAGMKHLRAEDEDAGRATDQTRTAAE